MASDGLQKMTLALVAMQIVPVIQGQNVWGVTYSPTKICAVKGSTVEIHCSYTYPSRTNGCNATVKKTFWFTKVNGRDPVDLTTDPQYSGRVQYDCDKIRNNCTLRITDLRESDSAEYKFRFITDHPDAYIGEPGVTLSVTGLQVSRSNNGLDCQSSCVPDRPSFIWYKNGQKIQAEASSSYYYLGNFNYEDSYSCAVKGYEDSPSPPKCADGETCNRVTYTDRNICASKGSSVDISCTYSSYENHVESKFWFSPERKDQWQNPSQPEDLSKDSQFAGRVQVIDTEGGRSTLRITDLRESDSAEYHFKFTTPSFEWRSSLPGTTLTVTALQVQVTRITVGQFVTEAELKCHSSCSPAGRLSYVWFNNKVKITGVETSSYKAQFGLSDNVSCAIRGLEEFPSPSVSNYTWYKETVNPRPLSEGPQLVFSSIQSSDSGQYYCTAENELGRRTSNDFIMDVKLIQGQNGWGVTYSPTKICAVKGSTVEIHCRYTYPSRTNGCNATVKKTFWFTKVNGRDPVDLTTDPQYSGRVQYDCDKIRNNCTLRVTDLRESDSAEYKFRFITDHPDAYIGEPGVTLSVTENNNIDVSRSNNGLDCQSSCVPDRPSFIWYKNGQKIQAEASSSSYYLGNFNCEDSYSCAVKGYEDSPSPPTCADGETCNRVTYTDRNICASKGSSVDISCTYSSYKNHVESKFWFSPERKGQWQNPSQPEDLSKDSQFAGRVQVIDTEGGRSTLRITDLRESDSAEYHFKFTTPSFEWRSSLPGTTLTVTALQVQVTRITVGQSVTEAELKCHSSCSPAGRLSYIWFNNKEEITGVETSSYKAQFGLSDNVSCAIRGLEEFPSPSVYAPKLPSVSVSPSAEIVEGSSVTLTCSSDANPAAKYTWYKKTVNPRPLSEGPQLVFSSIQSSDSGQYYCTAENELGRRTSNDFTMDVKYAPKLPSVSVSPSAEIVEGSSVTLTCSSDANPAANYTWYKETVNPRPLSEGPQLVFSSIQSSDSGQYYCTAENELGRRTSNDFIMDVKCE
ncbi:hemicentin-1-like [Epinephelus lanceolatus]